MQDGLAEQTTLTRGRGPLARVGAIAVGVAAVVAVGAAAWSAWSGGDDDVAATADATDVAVDDATTVPARRPIVRLDAVRVDPPERRASLRPPADGSPPWLGTGSDLRVIVLADAGLVDLDLDWGTAHALPIGGVPPDGDDGAVDRSPRHLVARSAGVLALARQDPAAPGLRLHRLVLGDDAEDSRLEFQLDDVTAIAPGWTERELVMQTALGIGIYDTVSEEFPWGPRPPPPGLDGRPVGAFDERVVFVREDGSVAAWGPDDGPDSFRSLVPAGGRLLTVGPQGPTWVDGDGLHVSTSTGVILIPELAGWTFHGAEHGLFGDLAALVRPPDADASELLVVQTSGEWYLTGDVSEVVPAGVELTSVRWSPEDRWLVLADPTLTHLVARGTELDVTTRLPTDGVPLGGAVDFDVLRVLAT